MSGASERIELRGVLAPGASVDLARLRGFAWQGGRIHLRASDGWHWRVPASWWVVGSDKYVVGAAGNALHPQRVGAGAAPRVRVATGLAIGHDRQQLDQIIELTTERPLFALPLRLGPHWRLAEARVVGSAQGVLSIERPSEDTAVLRFPAGLGGAGSACELALRYEPGSSEQAPPLDAFTPPQPTDAVIVGHDLSVAADAGLRVDVRASDPWHALPLGAGPSGSGLRVRLHCPGEPPALALAVGRRQVRCQVDAVTWFQPAPAAELARSGWLRCDLRVAVRGGRVRRLEADLPFAAVDLVRYDGARFQLVRSDGRWEVHFPRPWSGVATFRLEGPPAPEHASTLPALACSCPDGETSLRQWLVLQVDDTYELDCEPNPALVAVDRDELPGWSARLPGMPVNRAWRVPRGVEPGSLELRSPQLARRPDGFIDAVRVRSQLDRDGSLNLLTCTLSAPGLQSLELGLPAGTELIEARIDGHIAPARRTDGDLRLSLTGRTQCQLELRYRVAREDGGADWHLRQPLPRLGGLPVIRTAWWVGVPDDWLVDPVAAAVAVPMTVVAGRAPQIDWIGGWQRGVPAVERLQLPPLAVEGAQDPRRLEARSDDAAATAEPSQRGLALQGTLLAGERIGPGRLELQLVQAGRARLASRLGIGAALLLACAAVFTLRLHGQALLVVAAFCGAWALHGGAWHALAAASRMFPLAVLVILSLRWVLRRVAAAAPAVLLAALVLPGAATGAERVLGSYTGVDTAGRPQGVRVALTRQELARLEALAARTASGPEAPVPLAVGGAQIELTLVGETLTGTLRAPVAVFAGQWQALELELGPSRLGRVVCRDATQGVRELGVTATGSGCRLDLPPRSQGLLQFDLALQPGGTLPLPGGRGGELVVRLPAGRELRVAGQRAQHDDGGVWRAVLPLGANAVELSLGEAPASIPEQGRGELHIDQDVRVTLEPDRLEWRAGLTLQTRSSGSGSLAFALPDGLLLGEVRGSGVASWQQQDGQLRLQLSAQTAELELALSGVLPLTGGSVEVLLAARPEPRRNTVRLAFVQSPWGRLRLLDADLRRIDPRPGEALAYRLADPTTLPRVAWQLARSDLACRQYGALLPTHDHLRAHLQVGLRGTGACDRLHLALPEPWEPAAGQAGVVLVPADSQQPRHLQISDPDRVLQEGVTLAFVLQARRTALPEQGAFAAPDCRPLPGGPELEAQEWLLADAASVRLDPASPDARHAGSYRLLQRRFAGVGLPAGVQWRQAARRRGVDPLALRRVAIDAEVALALSHYLVMVEGRVRWSSRLLVQPRRGLIDGVVLRLPAQVRLLGLAADNLGGYEREGDLLRVRFAAPSSEPLQLSLELSHEVAGTLALTPYTVEVPAASVRAVQHTLAVVPDEVGLTHLDVRGLDPCPADRAFIAALPAQVDHRLLEHRWRGRGDWTLQLKHEEVRALGGADDLVTLVDGTVVLAADGSQRGRAVWHVVNRSRQQLVLTGADDLEIWQARVDGRSARFRHEADGALALPVPTLRPGQASIAVELTWARSGTGERVPIELPRFVGLRVMNGLMQVIPPPEHNVERVAGTMRRVPRGEAMEHRSQRVIRELERLRKQGEDLSAVGLQRLNTNLARLEQELADYTGQMQGLSEAADAARDTGAKGKTAAKGEQIRDNVSNIQTAQMAQQRIQQIQHARRDRDRALARHVLQRDWRAHGDAPAAPVPVPEWIEAGAWSHAEQLGVGQPPPGSGVVAALHLHGIDLLGDPRGEPLVFQAQSGELQVTLQLQREAGGHWRYLLAGLALVLVAIAGWWGRRPRGWASDPERLFRE
ncbi:MAG: hypothetical protein ACOCYV_01480 [Planctomycetota bacterium]